MHLIITAINQKQADHTYIHTHTHAHTCMHTYAAFLFEDPAYLIMLTSSSSLQSLRNKLIIHTHTHTYTHTHIRSIPVRRSRIPRNRHLIITAITQKQADPPHSRPPRHGFNAKTKNKRLPHAQKQTSFRRTHHKNSNHERTYSGQWLTRAQI
jgi:hypothetical protein